jgi:hypothetical protein
MSEPEDRDSWPDNAKDHPTDSGWYATIRCWDPQEGVFPGANFWDGTEWKDGNRAIFNYHGPFPDEESAYAWAMKHDPEA